MNPQFRRAVRKAALLFTIVAMLVICADTGDHWLQAHTSYSVNR